MLYLLHCSAEDTEYLHSKIFTSRIAAVQSACSQLYVHYHIEKIMIEVYKPINGGYIFVSSSQIITRDSKEFKLYKDSSPTLF